jgi:type IV pilus assembly protein PilP
MKINSSYMGRKGIQAMARLFPICCLCLFLVACSEEPPPPTAPAQKVAAPAKTAEVPVAVAVEPAQRFIYDPAGRRDPFQPLLIVGRQALDADPGEPLTPLQTYDIGQFRLIGVIIGKGEPRAMVVAPDGKSYVLQRNIKIGKNGGKVKEVQREIVLVEEKFQDFAGDVKTVIQEIKIPKREGV